MTYPDPYEESYPPSLWAPPSNPAPPADESPCDRLPGGSATKAELVAFLEDEWGHEEDAVEHMTKAELWALIHTHCD